MKTRFDGKLWIGAFGLALEVKDMETAHLLNTVKMLVQKPARVRGGHPQEVPPQRHQPHL